MSNNQKKIGVFSPSSWVEKNDIETAQSFLESHGFTCTIHPQTYERHNQSAGTETQKRTAFMELWRNSDIDIIWAAGGGNRCLHWIDGIDYKALANSAPKTVIGFSDCTALLNALYAHCGFESVHGPTLNKIPSCPQANHLFTLLKGEPQDIILNGATAIKTGTAQGPLIGGNLSVFQYLPQTFPGKFWEGAILFLEDWNEELSRLDRMFLHLKRLGVFRNAAGLIFGDFGDLPDTGKPFGFTLEEIIREHTTGPSIPIATNAPFGHGENLYSFQIGKRCELSVEDSASQLKTLSK